MKKIKKIRGYLWIALFLAVMAGFSAWGMLASTGKSKEYHISVIVSDSESDRWSSLRAGITQAAQDNGVSLNFVVTDDIRSNTAEMKLAETEIQSGADAILMDPFSSEGTEEMITSLSSRVVLELIENGVDASSSVEGRYAAATADDYEIGRSIASELMLAYGDELDNITIGIMTGDTQQYSLQNRLKGFKDALSASGTSAVIGWEVNDGNDIDYLVRAGQKHAMAQVIVALDNDSLEEAVDYVLNENVDVALYGEGCSSKNIYYLDKRVIKSMIVPDEYNLGYSALEEAVQRLENPLDEMENKVVDFRVVNGANMYDEENQVLLFPITE